MTRSTRIEVLTYVISPVVALSVWELLARTATIDARFFPPPSMIAGRLVTLLGSAAFLGDIADSLRRVGLGLLLGAIPGAMLGMAMGLSRAVYMALNPLIALTYPVPKTAIMPLLMLVFGLGDGSKVVAIAMGAFFLVLLSTYSGVAGLARSYFDVCRVFELGWGARYRFVVLPGALPALLTGLRLAIGYSFVLMVAAEFVGSRSGIGHFIFESWETFDIAAMYGGVATVAILGYASTFAMGRIERWLVPWRSVTAETSPAEG